MKRLGLVQTPYFSACAEPNWKSFLIKFDFGATLRARH